MQINAAADGFKDTQHFNPPQGIQHHTTGSVRPDTLQYGATVIQVFHGFSQNSPHIKHKELNSHSHSCERVSELKFSRPLPSGDLIACPKRFAFRCFSLTLIFY